MRKELLVSLAALAALALGQPTAAQSTGGWPDTGDVFASSERLPPLPRTAAPGLADSALVSFVESAMATQVAGEPRQISLVGASSSTKEGCGKCVGACSCGPKWSHCSGLFGEFLYLRPRDAEVAFAVPVDGVLGVQVGPTAVANPDFAPGYRAGFRYALDPYSSISVTYTDFESDTSAFLDVNPVLEGRDLVLHPGSPGAALNHLTASAQLDIDFDLLDADYRAVWGAGDLYAINYLVGARYAHFEQGFQAVFTNAGTTDNLLTNVSFDGAGFRLGLDAERHHPCRGWLVYGKTAASFMAGEFQTRYTQGTDVDPVIVDTTWEAGRIVTALDLELGAGWQSKNGCLRLTTGYVISAWFNTVNTDEWIQAVQANNFVGMNDGMTFDGLIARAEYRF